MNQRWSLNVASDQFDDGRRSCLLDVLDDFKSLAAIGVFSLSGLEVISEVKAIGQGSGPSAYIAAAIGRRGQRRPDETGD
ncbi:MAG: hypothetical protein GEV13_06845 [Rhodospirillales bacterium]|nr:hypothetical protein [Rhodospirillales bacterium]